MRMKQIHRLDKRSQAEKIQNIFSSRLQMDEEQKDDYTMAVFLAYEAMKTTPNEDDFRFMVDACNSTVLFLYSHLKGIFDRQIGMKCPDGFLYLKELGYKDIVESVNDVQARILKVFKRGKDSDNWTMDGELMARLKKVLEMYVHMSRFMPKRMLRLSINYIANLKKNGETPLLTINNSGDFSE